MDSSGSVWPSDLLKDTCWWSAFWARFVSCWRTRFCTVKGPAGLTHVSQIYVNPLSSNWVQRKARRLLWHHLKEKSLFHVLIMSSVGEGWSQGDFFDAWCDTSHQREACYANSHLKRRNESTDFFFVNQYLWSYFASDVLSRFDTFQHTNNAAHQTVTDTFTRFLWNIKRYAADDDLTFYFVSANSFLEYS